MAYGEGHLVDDARYEQRTKGTLEMAEDAKPAGAKGFLFTHRRRFLAWEASLCSLQMEQGVTLSSADKEKLRNLAQKWWDTGEG